MNQFKNESNPPAQAQEDPTPGAPPPQVQPGGLPPKNNVKYFCCGKCGQSYHTPDEVQVHLGTNHGITDNFMYHKVTAAGVTPITGIEEQPGTDPDVPVAKEPSGSETPAPGPKSVQEPSVSAPEVSETETVNPSPVPSPEEATCGSAPGREVGVGTDKEIAQNEPLSKKKAAEWAKIEDLDHNKVNLEAKLKASKAAAKITAETIAKNKSGRKKQNIEEATPGSAPVVVCSGSRSTH